MRDDRRRTEPYHRLFHAVASLSIEKMTSSISTCSRHSRDYTQDKIIPHDSNFVRNLTLKDNAHEIFDHDRGARAYFSLKRRKNFSL